MEKYRDKHSSSAFFDCLSYKKKKELFFFFPPLHSGPSDVTEHVLSCFHKQGFVRTDNPSASHLKIVSAGNGSSDFMEYLRRFVSAAKVHRAP